MFDFSFLNIFRSMLSIYSPVKNLGITMKYSTHYCHCNGQDSNLVNFKIRKWKLWLNDIVHSPIYHIRIEDSSIPFKLYQNLFTESTQMQFPRTEKHDEKIHIALPFQMPQYLVTPGLTYRQAYFLSKYEPSWLIPALV